MMHAASIQGQMASQLIDAVLGQSVQAQIDLATKLIRVSMEMNLKAPASTADVSGAGGQVDVVG